MSQVDIKTGTQLTALEMSEQAALLNSILESSTEHSIIATDLNGIILAWNEGARRIYGYEPSEVVGKQSAYILHIPEEVKSGFAKSIIDVAKEKGKWEGELTRIKKNSDKFIAHVTITLRPDTNGKAIGFTIISRDLTESKRIERELREAQDYNRGIIESNIDAFMTTDPEGIITDVNKQICEMTLYTREELIGTPFKNYFTEPQRAEDGISKVLAEDKVTNYQLTMRDKLGKETDVSYNATTFRASDGSLKGIFASARDITQQKYLDEQLNKKNRDLTEATAFVNNILESSTQYSIIAMDMNWTILAWNEGARRNYGYSSEEMVDKVNARVLYSKEDLESGRVTEFINTALKTGKSEGQFERVRKDGNGFTASVDITLRRDAYGQAIGFLLMSKDITEQKALEETLRRKNEELEEQNIRIKQANRLKSEFLANMSHELRTPLNAIIGFSELIHDGKIGAILPKQKEFLNDILTSSRHLLQLINDILDLAKVESGKMQFSLESCNLTTLVQEIRDVIRTIASKKHITIETVIDPQVNQVTADPGKLKQILYNYLSNAIKFTPEKGKVIIRIKSEDDENFRLEVADNGIGIGDEDMKRLFIEFQQLDASISKKYQGTGLGLALTKKIVESQGGSVGAVSIPGNGSTFYAVLPKIAIFGTLDGVEKIKHSIPTEETILIIEDERSDRTWLSQSLLAQGYNVDIAKTGIQGINLCTETNYKLITLDLLLPDISGWNVLNDIRKNSLNKNTPVIVISGVMDYFLKANETISDFLVKPVSIEKLLSSLKKAGLIERKDILVLSYDKNIYEKVNLELKNLDLNVIYRDNIDNAFESVESNPNNIVLIELESMGKDGFEFIKKIKSKKHLSEIPVHILNNLSLNLNEENTFIITLDDEDDLNNLISNFNNLIPKKDISV